MRVRSPSAKKKRAAIRTKPDTNRTIVLLDGVAESESIAMTPKSIESAKNVKNIK